VETVRWRDLARGLRRWHQDIGGSHGVSIREVIALGRHAGLLPAWASDRLRRSGAKPASWDLGDHALERFSMPFASRVTMRLRDSSTWTREQRVPLGGPGRPWAETHRLVVDKLARESSERIGDDTARRFAESAVGHDTSVSESLAALCA
jgi:hypothetical protein